MHTSPTKIFLSGIPATGKTTLGNLMAQKYSFTHLDMEADDGREANRLLHEPEEFFNNLSSHDRVVLTWGIPTWHKELIKEIARHGFKIIWLDGDRELSRHYYEIRSPRPDQIEAYRKRMQALEETNFIEDIKPIILNPYKANGDFKDQAALLKEIVEA